MRGPWAAILGLVVAMTVDVAKAGDGAVGGVPLPRDPTVQAGPPATAGPAGRFSGTWAGSWYDELRHVLVVEGVASDGLTANVVYAVADKPGWGIRREWSHRTATVAGDAPTVEGAASMSYVLERSGSLQATYRQGTRRRSYARLTRVPVEVLTTPDVAPDWSEPRSIFVDGPMEGGKPARLEVALLAPRGPGPFPLLVFNRGSTGMGRDPAPFRHTFQVFGLADFFVARGWMVAFPQRRGRGRSDSLYDDPGRRARLSVT